MKNISLALNAILIMAVVYLYYREFSGSSNQTTVLNQSLPESSIVFLNSDSLLDNYDFFNSLKSTLEKKQDSIDLILKSRARELEAEIEVYQKQAIGMTDMEKQLKEERLMQKQQDLMQLKQDMVGLLSGEEEVLNDSIHNNIVSFLKEFNKSRNYNYILGYQKGGGILLANDSLDITRVVLEGLNKNKE